MLAEPYRDINNDNNPIIGGVAKEKVSKLSFLGYLLTFCAFISSMVAYSQFDSLKDGIVDIAQTNYGAHCEMISAISETYVAVSASQYTMIPSNKYTFATEFNQQFPQCTTTVTNLSGTILGGLVVMQEVDSSYFATHEDCIASTNHYWGNIPSQHNYPYSRYGVGFLDPKWNSTSIGLTSANCINNNYPSYAEVNSFMNSNGYTEEIANVLCAPWLYNPPYKCTTYQTKNYLEILSQSFAISSAFLAGFIVITRIILSFFTTDVEPVSNMELEMKSITAVETEN